MVFNFYTFNLTYINKTYNVFWKLLKDHAPKLHDNLKEENVSCSVFLFEWVLTLYSSSFEIEICTYIWDQVFFYGDRLLIKVAIAICQIL